MHMYLQLFFLASSIFLIANANNDDLSYDYDMISTCTEQSGGLCTEWKHSGSIKREYSTSCFPEDTYVITLNGLTQMKDLKIGQHLLSYDIYSGFTVFSEMPTWFHFVRNESSEYVVAKTSDSTLTASPNHNIGFATDDNTSSTIAMFTHMVNLDNNYKLIGFHYQSDKLETTDVQVHDIIDTKTVKKMGLYAPYTRMHNYFVSDDGKYFYLAHSYAVIKNPVAYEYMVEKTFDMLGQFVTIDESQNSFLNPIAKALHNVLQLYENPMIIFSYLRGNRRLSENDEDLIVASSSGFTTLEALDFLTLVAISHTTNTTGYVASNNRNV